MLHQHLRQRRLASALVETAAVAGVFMLVLLGITEYCRFLFFLQLSENACREGCRFAVVNTTTDTDGDFSQDVADVVNQYMNNMGSKMRNFTVTVSQADGSGNIITGAASQSTPFGGYIVVQINYDYDTIAPSLMFLNKTLHVTTKAYMCSEAN
jgi:Flp pilus assembly protein TadG